VLGSPEVHTYFPNALLMLISELALGGVREEIRDMILNCLVTKILEIA
jgi:hypothetical protein